MSITKATLGGYPLLASAPVEWSFTEGVRPYEGIFHMIPRMARELLEKGGTTELFIETRGQSLTVSNLWVLDLVPLDNPQIVAVRVADRRWLLNRKILLRRYNMRRNIGHKRPGSNVQPILNDVTPDVWYWPWSLKVPGGSPPDAKWSPVDVLKDILDDVTKFEKENGGGSAGYVIREEINKAHRTLPVENLQLDDKADMALSRAVGLFPEGGLTVDESGQYVVFSKISGKEKDLHKRLGPNIVGSGYAEVVSHELEAPKEIELFFTIESEIRFDYRDDQSVTDDQRYMTNKLALPDFTLSVGGSSYVQGSWVDIGTGLFVAWGAGPPGSGVSQISNRLLQRAALPFLDLWAALMITGQRDPDKDWAGRVGALMTHWRKTFGLNKHWVDRFLTIRANRVGIVDPENGTLAPAEAYCDHSFIATQRSFFKDISGGADLRYAINVEGYPTGGTIPGLSSPGGAKAFTEDSKPASARVSVVDPDLGIIRVEFASDPNHMYEAALPGLVVREDGQPYIPGGDMSNPRRSSPTFDSIVDQNQIPKLSSDWKLGVVLTAIPAAPNDERQLFKVVVKPSDVKDMLPAAAASALSKARGPKWQVRIQPGADGARALIRWLDSRAPDIEKLFGIGDDKTPPNLDGLVMNYDPAVQPGGPQGASLNAIALAVSAAIYSRFTERLEGQATGKIKADMTLDGFMEAITHRVSTQGEATTTLTMARQAVELDMMSMLDSGTRAILLRQPHPEK